MAEEDFKISSILDLVLSDVPGVPVPLAERWLRRAVYEFLQRSQTWRVTHDPINLRKDLGTYDLDTPVETLIETVINVKLSGLRREPEIDFTLPERDIISLKAVPTKDTKDGMTLDLVLVTDPSCDAELDCRVYDDWAEYMAHGAKWKLMQIQGKDWSSKDSASYHKKEFKRGINRAFTQAVRGKMNRNLSVVRRPWDLRRNKVNDSGFTGLVGFET